MQLNFSLISLPGNAARPKSYSSGHSFSIRKQRTQRMLHRGIVQRIMEPELGKRQYYVIYLADRQNGFLTGRLPGVEAGEMVEIDAPEPKPGFDMPFLKSIKKINGIAQKPAAAAPTKQFRPSMSREDQRGAFICLGVTGQFHGAGAHGCTSGDILQAMNDWGNAYDAFHGNVTIVSTPKTPAKTEQTYSELNDEIPDHL